MAGLASRTLHTSASPKGWGPGPGSRIPLPTIHSISVSGTPARSASLHPASGVIASFMAWPCYGCGSHISWPGDAIKGLARCMAEGEDDRLPSHTLGVRFLRHGSLRSGPGLAGTRTLSELVKSRD